MTINEIISKVSISKTLKTISKYADKVGVKLGNIKDIEKARNKVLNALEKEQQDISNEMEAYRQKVSTVDYAKVKKAETHFKNSFKFASDIEKEVFLNDKTAYFLDKVQVSAPLTFHDFKNKKEFDEFMNSIAPEDRDQFKQDYINNLNQNNLKLANERLEASFNQKKQQFYDAKNLNWATTRGDRSLNDMFNKLDYVRKMEMLSIMDDTEYASMVESLVRQGYSEPLAMDISLKNLGFRPDGYYQIID